MATEDFDQNARLAAMLSARQRAMAALGSRANWARVRRHSPSTLPESLLVGTATESQPSRLFASGVIFSRASFGSCPATASIRLAAAKGTSQ